MRLIFLGKEDEQIQALKNLVWLKLDDFDNMTELQTLYSRVQRETIEAVATFKMIRAEFEKLKKWAESTGVASNIDIPKFPKFLHLETELNRLDDDHPFNSKLKAAIENEALEFDSEW